MLDAIILDLSDRFSDIFKKYLDVEFLLPVNLSTLSNDNIRSIIDKQYNNLNNILYCENINFQFKLFSEILQWRESLKSTQIVPETIEDVFIQCSEVIYPKINKLLIIYMTLPVSNAWAECTFSTLRRLKTYLRNRTSEERLSGLALLNIHRDSDWY